MNIMDKISIKSYYSGFKEDYCRFTLGGLYEFNGVDTLMNTLCGILVNTTKTSNNSVYLFISPNKCNIDNKLLLLW